MKNGEAGAVLPHLTFALNERFPSALETNGVAREPYRTDNFIVHERRDTGGNPFKIYQALPKLHRQVGLVETLRQNQQRSSLPRDTILHQRLEVIAAAVKDEPFYIIETMDGGPLDEVIDREDLKVETAYQFLRDLLKAIEPFHEHGLVIGSLDLEQMRIIRSQASQGLRLGGLFKAHEPDKPLNLGFNPEFNAPPPGEGDAPWTPSDDVYVAGMIAYRLFLGKGKYEENFATIRNAPEETQVAAWETRHRSGSIGRLPSLLNKDVSGGIEEWMKKALARQRSDRFPDAQHAAEALDRAWDAYSKAITDGPFNRTAGNPTITVRKKPVRKWIYVLAGAMGVVSLALLGADYYLKAPADVMAAIDADRNRILSAFREGREKGQALDATGEIVAAFSRAGTAYDAAQKDYPPYRSDAPALRQRFGEVDRQMQKALSNLNDLIAGVTGKRAEYAALLTGLADLVPPADQSLKDASAHAQRVGADVDAQKYDIADRQYGDMIEATKTRVGELIGLRDAAGKARQILSGRVEALSKAGISGLSPDHPMAKAFQRVQDIAAHAETLMLARDWGAARAAFEDGQANVAALATDYADLRVQADKALAAARETQDQLGAMTVAGDPRLSEYEARIIAADKAIAVDRRDLALRDMLALKAVLDDALKGRRDAEARAGALAAEAGKARSVLQGLVPHNNPFLLEAVRSIEMAGSDLQGRQYEKAAAALESLLPRVAHVADAAARERETAIGLKQAYQQAKPEAIIGAIGKLADDHPLRPRGKAIGEMVAAGQAALESREWSEAGARYEIATDQLKLLAVSVKGLADQVSGRIAEFERQLADIAAVGGERLKELEPLRNGLAQIRELRDQGRYDVALANSDTLLSQAAQLTAQLPVDKELLNQSRQSLEELRRDVAAVTVQLANGHPLKVSWSELERRVKLADAAALTAPMTAAARTFGDLAGEYRKLQAEAQDLVSAAHRSVEGLAAGIKEAQQALADGSSPLVDAMTALDASRKDLEGGKLDAALERATASSGALAAVVARSAEREKTISAAIVKINGEIETLTGGYGNWVLDLGPGQAVKSRLARIQEAYRARRYDEVEPVLGEISHAFSDWNDTVARKGTEMADLKGKAEAARTAAEQAGGADTAAFVKGDGLMNGGRTAADLKHYADAADTFVQAHAAYVAVAEEQASNGRQVAELRSGLAGALEKARILLPDAHALLPEVQEALNLGAGLPEDGTLTRLNAFRMLGDRLALASAEAGELRGSIMARLDAIPRRITEIEKAGGQTSSRFAPIAGDLESARRAADAREWGQAQEALLRAETAIAAIDEDIARGLILACPNSGVDNGTRLVPAGTYSMGGNSLAGRIAADARTDMRVGKSASIVIQTSAPFCVSMQQVSVEEYEAYLDESGTKDDVREALLDKSGNWPNSSDDVTFVTQADAENYAKWFSDKTGLNYALPTLEQSLAAVALASKVESNNLEVAYGLGNSSREWTREACGQGGRTIVLGTIGEGDFQKHAQCLSKTERNPALGFRLVIVQR